METNKDIDLLIKRIKSVTNLTQAGIAERIKYSREYLSQSKKTNPEGLYALLEEHFNSELKGVIKPGKKGDPANMKWAMLKMIYQRLAKIEADRLGLPIEQVMKEMDDETMIAWHDLEKGE